MENMLLASRMLGCTKLYLKPIPTWKKTLDMPSCVLSQVEVRRGVLMTSLECTYAKRR